MWSEAVSTYFTRQIKKMLQENGGEPSPDILTWFHTYEAKGEFDLDEARELRGILGIDGPPLYAPFSDLVPGGWLGDLLEVVEEAESPRPFYVLTGMAVMGALVGRRVMIDRGTHKVSLPLSTLLISPAGETRRSTAADFVIYGLGKPAGLQYIADSFSYEAFGDALAEIQESTKSASAMIYAGEMSVMMGKGSYGESIIPKLTDLLGKTSPFHWRTVKRGQVTFREPCLNAVMTTAPDWLADNIPAVAFGGGMLSRFLTCVAERREKVVVWAEAVEQARIDRLVTDLKRLTSRTGVFARPEGPAMKWYADWYMELAGKMDRNEVPDERMRPYLSRKHDHLLRMAAVLTIAAGDELVYTKERLEQSLRILDWLEQDMPRAYSAMALSPQAAAQRAVLQALERKNGTMSHSDLHKAVYRQCPLSTQFREVMQSLIGMGAVQSTSSMGGRGLAYVLRRTLD